MDSNLGPAESGPWRVGKTASSHRGATLQQSSSGIIGEQFTLPDVVREHGLGRVARLRLDAPCRNASLGSARSEPCAE
jgi:hypothetical protein